MSNLIKRIDTARKWWVLVGVSLAGLLVSLDYTVVNICLPTIQHYFSTSTNTLQWLMLGFGITFSSCLASSGKLADIIGRRKVLYASVMLFILASLGAGLAHTMLFLICMRLLQGLCAAAIFPCGTAIIATQFSPNEQSRVIGIFGSILGIGLAIGPVLGGIIVSHLSWQWVFFINIPISLIALFICIVLGRLEESKHPSTPPIDWIGTFSLILGVAGICFMLSQATLKGWSSPIVICSFLIAIIAFTVLVINSKKSTHPIIPPNLLTNKSFLLSSVVFLGTISVSWAVAFYIPLYLRKIPHFSITTASLWFFIMTVMTVICPTISGAVFDKYSKTAITHVTFLLSIIGLLTLAAFTTTTSTWLMILAFVIFGMAWGVGNGISMPIGLMAFKDHTDAGIVSGALLTIANAGGTLFIAIATSLFSTRETSSIFNLLKTHHISLTHNQSHQIKTYLADPDRTGQLIKTFGHPTAHSIIQHFQTGFMSGFSLTFLIFSIVVLILYILAYRTINQLLSNK